ncbi:tetratricopeptide repeat protein [Desulfohalovibrio reitneri]|uniref:tetratricopeptide repeat protein n=1 Tax=Desulfohalovibrio reitneri TaxID=1307759 RepID=UPI0004A6DD5D|nr:tetratricopeptide repeat protein [Desulfohalovibrio reitneri]
MSAELTKARSHISRIHSHLKQQKTLPAAQALYEALRIILTSQLMKSERSEFSDLIEQAIYQLTQDPNFKQAYPLKLEYEPGKEKQLYRQMGEVMKELQASTTEEAQGLLAMMEQRKKEGVEKVQANLDAGKHDEAKKLADDLVRDFKDDTDLKADIADRFLQAGLYQEAFDYLDEALRNDPEAVHLYNRIGIVLRKMKDFDTAERYYRKALECCKHDEYLYFNIGRLYYDWQKWHEMADMAKRALKLNPEFTQAKKMLQFAHKKLGN